MKITINEPVKKEIDINFSLVTVMEQSHFSDQPTLGMFMQFNEKTYNCCVHLGSFRDRETAWATLEPMIKTLLDNCYAI